MATSTSTLGKRRGHLVFFLVVAGHAVLLSSQVTMGTGHSALHSLLLAALSPFQRGAEACLGGVQSLWYGYMDLRGVREENERLRARIERLEQTLWMEREIVASYDRMSRVLNLAERLPFDSIVAEVIGFDASSWFRTITVNRGSANGVELNAPVIAPGGLVGRVVAVGPKVAQVQLLSDRDCAVGALLVRTRARGIVSGAEDAELDMKYVSNLDDVVIGDLVVTSGMDGLYPKGLAVGRVSSVLNGPRLFKRITIEPAARLDRLEEVFIYASESARQEFTEKVDSDPKSSPSRAETKP